MTTITLQQIVSEEKIRHNTCMYYSNMDKYRADFDTVAAFLNVDSETHKYHYPNLSRIVLDRITSKKNFEKMDENEFKELDKLTNKSPMRYVDTNEVLNGDVLMTIDINSFYPYVMKSMSCPATIGKFVTVTTVDPPKGKISYYKMKIDLTNLPFAFWKPKEKRSEIWLSNYDVAVFNMFNKPCKLLNHPNNCYTYDRFERCDNKTITDLYHMKTIDPDNKVWKMVLNGIHGLTMCMMKHKVAPTDEFSTKDMFSRDCTQIVRASGLPLYPEFYRAYVGLYSVSRYMLYMSIKTLLDNNVKIHRIATDSITCDQTNKLDSKIKPDLGYFKLESNKFRGTGQFNNVLVFVPVEIF